MGNVLTVGIGAAPNDTTGDPLRTAMSKIETAVNGLAANFSGPTPPPSLTPFQFWFDTSTTPPTRRVFDGSVWVAEGTLNQSTHAWGSLAAPSGSVGGDLSGTLPSPTISALAVTNAKMAAGSAAANVGALGGDFSGALPSPTIAKIQGTAVSGVTGTGNVVLSAAPTITGAASISSIPFNPSTAVQSQFSAPNAPGISLTGGAPFFIAGSPTAAGQDTAAGALYVAKYTNFTGIPASPAPAIYGFNNVVAGAQGTQIGILGNIFNANTLTSQPSGTSGAVAVYGTAYCAVAGATATWAGVISAYDISAQNDPPHALYGLEVDVYANGTDANLNRIGIQINASTPNGTGTVNTVGHGLMFNGSGGAGNGKFVNLIDGSTAHTVNGVALAAMTITGIAYNSPGFQVDGLGNISGQTVTIGVFTIAQLLAISSPVAGQTAYVSDTVFSAAPTLHGTIAGSGSTTAKGIASYNGANWQWA